MRKTNALQIQETLKKQKYVTVPWLQTEYELTYNEAKQFLQQLILRGWVEDQPTGIRYAILRKRLCLRKIQRSEVDGLYTDLNNDCVQALSYMEKQEGNGVTESELERVIRGDEDTETAIKILLKHKLIYQGDELYFLAVSKKTVQVLWMVEMEKRKTAMRRKITDSNDVDDRAKKLFDTLFEDEE